MQRDLEEPALPACIHARHAGDVAGVPLADEFQAAGTFGDEPPAVGQESERPGMLEPLGEGDDAKVVLLGLVDLRCGGQPQREDDGQERAHGAYHRVMNYTTLVWDLKDKVARITLNRPDFANALNAEMGRELMHAAIRASEDPAVRAVILTGAGKMFCGGGDLKHFASQGDALPAHLKELAGCLHMAISRFVRMDAPLIAAVNGSAGGAGLSLCLFADVVLAAESSKFTLAYTKAGLAPDGGSTYFLPRIVGLRRALEMA